MRRGWEEAAEVEREGMGTDDTVRLKEGETETWKLTGKMVRELSCLQSAGDLNES